VSRIRLTVSLIAAATAVLACDARNGATGQTSASADGLGEQLMLRRVLRHEDIEREFFVHIPRGAILGTAELPVVIAIHGYTSTATGFQAAHGLNRHADEHGYIAVYPQGSHFFADVGQGGAPLITSWNDLAANQAQTAAGPHCTTDSIHYPCPPECGECTRCGWTTCYDDVGFLTKLLDATLAEFPIDAERVYLLGVSNGAMMALRLGCERSSRFAAMTAIIGQLAPGYACGPEADLPMLHLYGGQDETVRPDGMAGSIDGFIYTSAAETASTWASAMACETGPAPWQNEISEQAEFACTAYSNCAVTGHEIVGCMDPDGGHVWPEQGVKGMPATCVTAEQYASLSAQAHCEPGTGEYSHLGMDLVWDFFSRYRLSLPRD
jgi:polyhydroxybutyrate depolymerase